MIKFESKGNSKTVGQIVRGYNEELTIENFLVLKEKFVQDKVLEGLAIRTIEEYRIHFRWLEEWICCRTVYTKADRLTSDLFRSYLYYMSDEKGLANTTINIRLRTLKCYLRWLYSNDYSHINYSIRIKLLKVVDDRVMPASKEGIQKVLRIIDTSGYAGFRDSIIIICILDTGIRIGELLHLKVGDIDIKGSLIKVRAEVSKTRSERSLPISKKTLLLLRQLVDVSKENQCDYLFLSSYSPNAINGNNIIKNFQRYGEKAGVKDFTPYKLRHTFAVEAVKRNIDIFTLQRIMGHSSITTTRQYIQLETEDIQKKHREANILDSLLT